MAIKFTEKQAAFVALMVEGKLQQYKCYGAAGYAVKGHSVAAVTANAAKLAKAPKIAAAIAEGRAKTAELANITAMDIVDELQEARKMAIEDRDPGAMVRASMGKAKVLGLDKIIVELVANEKLTPWSDVVAGVDK